MYIEDYNELLNTAIIECLFNDSYWYKSRPDRKLKHDSLTLDDVFEAFAYIKDDHETHSTNRAE